MKKILLVVPLSTLNWGSKNAGGVDSVCQMLVEYLSKREHSPYLYRILAFDPFCAEPYTGKVIKLSPFVEVVTCPTNEKRFGLPILGIVATALRVREQVRLFSPDIIHSHIQAWLIGIFTSANKIATIHSYKKIGRKPVSPLNDLLYEKIVPWLSGFFTNQYTCVGDLLYRALSADIKKTIKVIGNPIDNAYFSLVYNKDESSNTINLVTCALISRSKRIDKVILLVDKLKKANQNVMLKIIGPNVDDVYYQELIQIVDELDLSKQIDFLGRLGRNQIINEYKQSNLGVFFSKQETFGLTPLEMLAAGLPLLTTSVGILDERKQVFAEKGVKFINNDADFDIEDIIKWLNTATDSAKEYVRQEFSVANVVRQYEELYKETSR